MADRDGRVWRDASLAGMSTPPPPSSTPEVRPPASDSASTIPDPSPGSASGLAAHVQSLGWESREFSDVRVTAFGKEYPLHRLVLSRSPYFRALMRGPWADASSPSLTLAFDDPFVTAPAVECCLAFLYDKPPAFERHGEDEPVDPLFALRVLAASNFLDLDHLSRLCADFTAHSVSLRDCLALQAALDAREYGEHGERARVAVWGFICAHASLELKHDLHRLHPVTLDALLRSDHLWVADETERFALARAVAADGARALDRRFFSAPGARLENEKKPKPKPKRTDHEEEEAETRGGLANVGTASGDVARLLLDDLVERTAAGAEENRPQDNEPYGSQSETTAPDAAADAARRRALDFHVLATAATLRDGVRYQHIPFDDLRVMKRTLECEEKDVRAAAYRRMARGEDDVARRLERKSDSNSDDDDDDVDDALIGGRGFDSGSVFSLEATRALLDSTPARAVAEGWWTRTALAARVARSKGGARKSDWARGVDAPFRFGALFEKVKELRDGQGAKHSREVFYAGSLWKVSVQAFVDEDPKGRRTLGLFLHRRPASEGEVDEAIGGGHRRASQNDPPAADADADALRSSEHLVSEPRARNDALDALTRGSRRDSRNARPLDHRARGALGVPAPPDGVSGGPKGFGGVSHFSDRREVVDVRYELVCPSRHETVRLGSLDASAKPTTLPRAPKGWGWRTALLHEDLEHMCDAQGALRVVAAIVVDAAAEDAGEYDAQVDADDDAEAAARAVGDDALDDTEGFDGDVEENGREHLVLRY
jgi:hypothetical protein